MDEEKETRRPPDEGRALTDQEAEQAAGGAFYFASPCRYCDEIFPNSTALLKHIIKKHPDKC